MIIEFINRIADQPDAVARVRTLIGELQKRLDDPHLESFIDEMEEKAVFIASAIVSGGHVHTDMAVAFNSKAAGL
jgi:hypothetical protein